MDYRLDKIEEKIDKILDKVSDHGERLTKVETSQSGFIAVSTIIFTALVGAVTAFFFNLKG